MSRLNILFLSAWYPFPPNNGSKLRIYNILQGLVSRHDIHLITFYEETDDIKGDVALRQHLQQMVTVPYSTYDQGSSSSIADLFSPVPRSFIKTYSAEMKRAIHGILDQHNIDIVVATQLRTAIYVEEFQNLPSILDEIELSVMYEQFKQADSLRNQARYGLTWLKHRKYLNRVVSQFSHCTVVTEKEQRLLTDQAAVNETPCSVISNGVDLDAYRADATENPINQNPTLVYTGSFTFLPNYEAMVWFVGEILPLIQARFPNAELLITGNRNNMELPPNPNVKHLGYVDDIRAVVAEADISIVPLLVGGGTRLKILEAMALKTPVVATSKGAEGLCATSGREILIGDSPESFANAVILGLENAELRSKIANSAFNLVASTYDWKIILPQFFALVERAALNAPRFTSQEANAI